MNTRLFAFFIILLPLLVACGGDGATINPPQIALDDSKLQFVSIENIGGSRDVAGLLEANITPPINQEDRDRTYPQTSTISPDGERIIFQRDVSDTTMICVYQFSANATACTDLGELIPPFEGGFWSPDGRYLVLNMDTVGLQRLRDVDVLIYDTQDNRLINRTDDGVSYRDRLGGRESENIRAKMWMDVAPIWSPNGDLYFFHNAIDPEFDEWRADLMRIPASEISGTSDPEVVWRHPITGSFPVFRTTDWHLDGAMSISPDGKYLAVASYNFVNLQDTANGIWLFDLEEKSVKIQIPVSRLGEAIIGVPTWLTQHISDSEFRGIFPNSLAWANDSNTLIIRSINGNYYTEFFVPIVKYDVATDALSSFYDFTTLSEGDYKPDTTLFDGNSLRVDTNPIVAVMSPSYQTVFYISLDNISDEFILSAMSVVESGFTTPRRIASFNDYEMLNQNVTRIGYSAPTLRILTGAYLITLAEE